jgi:glycosyltransferase involved in cell wall biosynthesis
MKVAFVSQPFEPVVPPVQGGSLAIWTYQVTSRLTSSCEFTIYARRGPGQQKEQRHNDVLYRRMISARIDEVLQKPLQLLERLLGHPNPTRPLFASPLYYLGYIRQIASHLRLQPCDIVHIWNFSQFVPIIRSAKPDAKIVLHMECEWLTQLDRAMIERRLEDVDLILGCSEYIAGKIRQRFPRFASRCHAVFNGVDAEHFGEQESDSKIQGDGVKRLLFVGRVSPEKGVHILLDAFRKVVEHCPQVQLDIVGPAGAAPIEYMVLISDDEKVSDLASFYGRYRRGDYLAQLEERVFPSIAEQVNFVGSVPQPDLTSFYRQADILVNPSLTEAFGMSLIEAMASGVPVVASRVGGMTEIIGNSGAGILLESGDATALADALIDLLENGSRMRSMGRAGPRRVAELYTWDRVSESLLHHYRELCGQAG